MMKLYHPSLLGAGFLLLHIGIPQTQRAVLLG